MTYLKSVIIKKKYFAYNTELVFVSKFLHGLKTTKLVEETQNFLILQLLPLLHFKRYNVSFENCLKKTYLILYPRYLKLHN